MIQDNLYLKTYQQRFGELEALAPKAYQSFSRFKETALAPSVLPTKTKQLISIAAAHILSCSYCIEAEVTAAKQNGITQEEMTEAIMVATMLKAGSAIAHGINGLNAYDEIADDSLYKRTYLHRFKELKALAPDIFSTYSRFTTQTMHPGALQRREKELIAFSMAHVTGCVYCIEAHTKKAQQLKISKEELTEAILVGVAIKACSVLYQGVNFLNAYDSYE